MPIAASGNPSQPFWRSTYRLPELARMPAGRSLVTLGTWTRKRARRRAREPGCHNEQLKEIIDRATEPWGIQVVAVETKDVDLPDTVKLLLESVRGVELAPHADGA
jgi:hypothetical protein